MEVELAVLFLADFELLAPAGTVAAAVAEEAAELENLSGIDRESLQNLALSLSNRTVRMYVLIMTTIGRKNAAVEPGHMHLKERGIECIGPVTTASVTVMNRKVQVEKHEWEQCLTKGVEIEKKSNKALFGIRYKQMLQLEPIFSPLPLCTLSHRACVGLQTLSYGSVAAVMPTFVLK